MVLTRRPRSLGLVHFSIAMCTRSLSRSAKYRLKWLETRPNAAVADAIAGPRARGCYRAEAIHDFHLSMLALHVGATTHLACAKGVQFIQTTRALSGSSHLFDHAQQNNGRATLLAVHTVHMTAPEPSNLHSRFEPVHVALIKRPRQLPLSPHAVLQSSDRGKNRTNMNTRSTLSSPANRATFQRPGSRRNGIMLDYIIVVFLAAVRHGHLSTAHSDMISQFDPAT